MSWEDFRQKWARPEPSGTALDRWRAKNIEQGLVPAPKIEDEAGNIHKFSEEFGKGIVRGFLNVGEGIVGTADWLIPGEQEFLEEAEANIEAAGERFAPTHKGAAAWTGRIVGEALPYMGSALVGGYAGAAVGAIAGFAGVGGAVGSGMVGFAVMGDEAYDEAKARGATDLQANSERVIVGSINAIIEASQIGRLMRFHKAGRGSLKHAIKLARGKAWKLAGNEIKGFTGQVAKVAIQEAFEEMAQEGVSIVVPRFVEGYVPRTPDGEVDFFGIARRVGEAGLGGFVAGGILGGGGAAIGSTPALLAPTESEIQNTATAINDSGLNDAEKTMMLRELEGVRMERPVTEEGKQVEDAADDSLVSPEQIPLETLRDKLSGVVEGLERLRPEERAAMSKERGKRFGKFASIVAAAENPLIADRLGKAALRGQLKADIPPVDGYLYTEDIYTAYLALQKSTTLTEGQRLSGYEGLNKMLEDGIIPARHELKALVKAGILTPKSAKSMLDNRTRWAKSMDTLKDLAFAPWSLVTGYDISAPGRQGWLILFKSPKLWAKTVGRAYRMLGSEKYYKFAELRRQTNPYYKQAIKDGVEETGIDDIDKAEEKFGSRLVQKLPGIRGSARAYVGALNELRFGWYNQVMEQADGHGMTQQQRKDVATIANDLTGRGKLPKALKKLQDFGLIFFAPRLQAARIRTITDLVTKQGPGRKALAYGLVSFLGITLSTLMLIDRHDEVEVEWNPKSTDFLKIRYGNTRVDITGGYQQYLRTIAQIITGERKGTEDKRLYTADRKETIKRFIQSKLSPHAGLAVDLWRGEDFLGNKLRMEGKDIAEQAYNRVAPLFFQDVIDTARHQGLSTAGAIAPLAFHGITVQSYPVRTSQHRMRLQNKVAGEMFNGSKWDELGPAAQKVIKEYTPQIERFKEQERKEREDFDFLGKMMEEAHEISRKIEKSMPSKVKREMEELVVRIPGLSRHIDSSWYLNDKRYKQYQGDVKRELVKYMSAIMSLPDYNNYPADVRREVLNELIDEVKANVRMKLITTANIKDLKQL